MLLIYILIFCYKKVKGASNISETRALQSAFVLRATTAQFHRLKDTLSWQDDLMSSVCQLISLVLATFYRQVDSLSLSRSL